ncbi:MAG: HAD hydrolase-like protein [Eubacterium sp.]|nr:HAD hydrolase-like protein [Eubacterium sp.]
MRYKNVIFDFDGTLCDTGIGIMKSAKYALESFGYSVGEDFKELSCFIGPPLLVTFQEKYGAQPQEAEELVKKYRERYTDIGLFESELYDGMIDLLSGLKKGGFKIGIASSKPQIFVERLLEHFEILDYFDAVCGVTFDADCVPKSDIIAACMEKLNAIADDTLMVGDKRFDIEGARLDGIDSAGVLWGYGTKFELIEASAKFIAEKPSDIESIALGFFEQTEEVSGIFSGRIITVHEDTVMLVDGSLAKRELVDHPGGVAIVPLTDKGEVLMVRQFRAPYKETIYEIPAGKLERGEDPREAGIRELEEECGVTAESFFELGEIYPTPGYCSEIIRIYGATGLKFGEQSLDEDEFLDVYSVPLETAFEKCMSGEFKDAKTIVGIFKIREMRRNGSLS